MPLLGPVSGASRSRTPVGARLPRVPRFATELSVPPVLRGARAGGVDHYVVRQRQALRQVLPPGFPATPVWGYEGRYPGPTIVATRGVPVHVRQENHLPSEVSTHLHGSASRPVDDGQPFLPIPPGGHRTYHYPNAQRAASLWYHDHADMRTSPNVYRGLAGMYVLHDPQDDRLGLPQGPYDVPLIVQDRTFDQHGRMVFDDHMHTDVLGAVNVVNGRAWPRMAVAARRYRFRVLVASNSRPYLFALSRGLPLTVVGSDGGLLERPVRTRTLLTVMAERYDVVVDFSTVPVGTSVTLQNLLEVGPLRDVMRFDVVRRARDDSRVPARLCVIEPLTRVDAPASRVWRFGRDRSGDFVINGRPYDEDRVDAHPRLGSVEVWELRSVGLGFFHPVHPHLVQFQVLSRDGGPPLPYERGWKDTVYVGEAQVVRIAARFAPYRGRYVMHCHNLVHEDHQMMTQFQVV